MFALSISRIVPCVGGDALAGEVAVVTSASSGVIAARPNRARATGSNVYDVAML
jgi:hypothetical protein